MPKAKSKIEIKNKRAGFEYEFIDNYTAGIVLTGTEIKSIRAGKASLVDSYCYFVRGELYVKNMHVAEYWWGTYNAHDPRRDRKLLLNRKEPRGILRVGNACVWLKRGDVGALGREMFLPRSYAAGVCLQQAELSILCGGGAPQR
jgi:hypothetical protein